MAQNPQWRRVELRANLYRELELMAQASGVSTPAYAAVLISRGLRLDQQLAETSAAYRAGRLEPMPVDAWADPRAWPDKQDPSQQ